mmetsp:Transcript_79918/g.226035  ORF Transcript_79918/g.226035 Transcript_79918/m.226035 type:complete len:350 (+) Transcript_79918:218-1267(+)
MRPVRLETIVPARLVALHALVLHLYKVISGKKQVAFDAGREVCMRPRCRIHYNARRLVSLHSRDAHGGSLSGIGGEVLVARLPIPCSGAQRCQAVRAGGWARGGARLCPLRAPRRRDQGDPGQAAGGGRVCATLPALARPDQAPARLGAAHLLGGWPRPSRCTCRMQSRGFDAGSTAGAGKRRVQSWLPEALLVLAHARDPANTRVVPRQLLQDVHCGRPCTPVSLQLVVRGLHWRAQLPHGKVLFCRNEREELAEPGQGKFVDQVLRRLFVLPHKLSDRVRLFFLEGDDAAPAIFRQPRHRTTHHPIQLLHLMIQEHADRLKSELGRMHVALILPSLGLLDGIRQPAS